MRAWLPVSLCLFAVGCISTNVERLDQAVRPERSPDSVAVLGEAPAQPHTVIAVIEARGESVFDSFEDLRTAMVTEAARLGGDAVILGPESTDTDFILTGTAMIRSDRRNASGTVIVYASEGETADLGEEGKGKGEKPPDVRLSADLPPLGVPQ